MSDACGILTHGWMVTCHSVFVRAQVTRHGEVTGRFWHPLNVMSSCTQRGGVRRQHSRGTERALRPNVCICMHPHVLQDRDLWPGSVRVPGASRALVHTVTVGTKPLTVSPALAVRRGVMVSAPCYRRSTTPRGSHCEPKQQACVSVHCWPPAGGCSEPAGQARVSKAKARGWQRPVIIKWQPGLPFRRVSLSRAH